MDFDPSAFLSMAMTEDPNAFYSGLYWTPLGLKMNMAAAPDVPQGLPDSVEEVPPGKIVIEGGLQMEQEMQIPVPVFGLLQEQVERNTYSNEEQNTEVNAVPNELEPIYIDSTEPDNNTTQYPSPVERTSSPVSRKIIHTSIEETRFRKEFYFTHFERVKIFRLHCSICDKHLGCAPWVTERSMRTHKLLNVVTCRQCFEFYGDINFPTEEGSELYCCWCGEGGECFCCTTCPRIVCKKCVNRNFGAAKVIEIDKNDDWACFVCKPEEIWPHRAILWGLQRWRKQLRQQVASLPKEEKQNKLSKDSSHCCPDYNSDGFLPVNLPPKNILAKIPLCLIADCYHSLVRYKLMEQKELNTVSNNLFTATSTSMNRSLPSEQLPSFQNRATSPMIRHLPPLTQQTLPTLLSNPSRISFLSSQIMKVTNKLPANRPTPYHIPTVRSLPTTSRFQSAFPQSSHYSQRGGLYQINRNIQQLQSAMNGSSSNPVEVIDLEREPQEKRALQIPVYDISALSKGVTDVREALRPTINLIDQFSIVRNDLTCDFSKLTSYWDRLSYNIKIAICNLAKINEDIMQAQKKIVDSKVSSVINNIQLNGISSSTNLNEISLSPKYSNSCIENKESGTSSLKDSVKTPPRTPEIIKTEPMTPATSSTDEDMDLSAALLCETVLEVEDNKENKNGSNKDKSILLNTKDTKDNDCRTPVKKSKPIAIKQQGLQRSPSRSLNKKNAESKFPVTFIVDDDDGDNKILEGRRKNKFNDSYYEKKFKLKRCKVVLERLAL